MKSWIYISFIFSICCISCVSCSDGSRNSVPISNHEHGKISSLDLSDIQQNGEIIILTKYGADTYFEYQGEEFGNQFMIVLQYAKSIGVGARAEICRSDEELLDKLRHGEGDIIASNINTKNMLAEDITQHSSDTIVKTWCTMSCATQLTESLQRWIADNQNNFIAFTTVKVKAANGRTYSPRRKVAAPIRNLAKGEISIHDNLFRQYSKLCNWDWRLMAAQAFQESGFDPEAVSHMGALGLMQLMPQTARNVGVNVENAFNPEENIKGAVRLINELERHYSDIKNPDERINFILAAYNAGPGHIDDARTLARTHQKNPDVWFGNVDQSVLKLSESRYFNLPEVRHGYMRGNETYNYVNSIRSRWDEYKQKIHK